MKVTFTQRERIKLMENMLAAARRAIESGDHQTVCNLGAIAEVVYSGTDDIDFFDIGEYLDGVSRSLKAGTPLHDDEWTWELGKEIEAQLRKLCQAQDGERHPKAS